MVENPSPPLPQFQLHTISQTLQNLHVESCVDSLTLRCEFMVHNSMAVKKNSNMTLIFDLLLRDFFGLGDSMFPLYALRLQLDVVIVDPRFVTLMTLSNNSSLSSEVFQSTQHSFRRNFCSGVSSFGIILAQTFFMSKCSVKIV